MSHAAAAVMSAVHETPTMHEVHTMVPTRAILPRTWYASIADILASQKWMVDMRNVNMALWCSCHYLRLATHAIIIADKREIACAACWRKLCYGDWRLFTGLNQSR